MNILKLSQGGRIVIPADLRQKLNLQEGDELICEERGGELVLATKPTRIRRAQELFQEWFPIEPGRSLVDELMAERRAEVARDDQEAQDEYAKNHNRA
ncbi:MAG: AbrB/MazE/SpoVT family DNA-binding domain-containing protein [Pseudomonadales bacterium]|nr:AbrB/MazE/SpoVT family DNA-binding domain-containing protein [Pseudomonadales bacterium]